MAAAKVVAKRIIPSDLPMHFQVKYLGSMKAKGMRGVKFTRDPVDFLMESSRSNRNLPTLDVTVTHEGLELVERAKNKSTAASAAAPVVFKVEAISYGVQDTEFKHVFCIIVVKPGGTTADAEDAQYNCHAFACSSKQDARRLTYALAAAFKHAADRVKAEAASALRNCIDLRDESVDIADDEDADC